MNDEERIRELVDRLNRVWVTGDTRPMRSVIHPDAVLVLLELGQQTQGRESYIQTTETFLREMKNRTFRFGERTVRLWGDTAVANQLCEMSFLLEKHSYIDVSSITMTFSRIGGDWQLVWTEVFIRTKAGDTNG